MKNLNNLIAVCTDYLEGPDKLDDQALCEFIAEEFAAAALTAELIEFAKRITKAA